MRPFLLLDGKRYPLQVAPGTPQTAEADLSCPFCTKAPLRARGTGRRASEDDQAWEANAVSTCCGQHVGILRVEMDTLFGVREDNAVLNNGRARVYG